MKKLSMVLAALFLFTCTASCGKASNASADKSSTELRIVTAFGSDDGNYAAYTNLLKDFEASTGVKVTDDSGKSSEEWKAKVNGDFQTDNEPDVLMYFTGYDSNEIIRSGKIVPVREIQEQYPEYASNMRTELMPASIVDGKFYAVPVNGYWEGLFVNKKVLAECGITDIPDKDTTWDEFLKICEEIKQAGKTPIAVSLQEVPHYLIEYMVFNEGNPSVHTKPPTNANDYSAHRWIVGLLTVKDLFEKGYLPYNTLTASDSDTFWQFCLGETAFAIDGSWRIGWMAGTSDKNGVISPGNVDNIDDFTVTYVPGSHTRKSTDIISGISMGYFITKRAWNDPAKRDAAVKLVEALTSDEATTLFSQGAPTALINMPGNVYTETSLHKAAQELLSGATSRTSATQDLMSKATRTYLFASIGDIVTGKVQAYDALYTALSSPLSSEIRADN